MHEFLFISRHVCLTFGLVVPRRELRMTALAEFLDGRSRKLHFPVLVVLMALLALALRKRRVLVCRDQFRAVGAMGVVATGAGRLVERLAVVSGGKRLVLGIMAGRAEAGSGPLRRAVWLLAPAA